MTKLLEQALEVARNLPSHVRVVLTDDERAAIATSKQAAARGEFATDAQVRATWAKHGH